MADSTTADSQLMGAAQPSSKKAPVINTDFYPFDDDDDEEQGNNNNLGDCIGSANDAEQSDGSMPDKIDVEDTNDNDHDSDMNIMDDVTSTTTRRPIFTNPPT